MTEKEINSYLDMAEDAAKNSTCLRANYGSAIIKDGQVLSFGYNDVPKERANCKELGYCIKEKLKIEHGDGYSKCRAICSEQNAIIKANPEELVGSYLFLVGMDPVTKEYLDDPSPCPVCERFIINAKIKEVYVRLTKDTYKVIKTDNLIVYDASF